MGTWHNQGGLQGTPNCEENGSPDYQVRSYYTKNKYLGDNDKSSKMVVSSFLSTLNVPFHLLFQPNSPYQVWQVQHPNHHIRIYHEGQGPAVQDQMEVASN